jgi:hypothetical protein
MAIVIEFLVFKILISGLETFQPDVAIGAVDREMVGNEELQPAADVPSESMLRVGKVAGAVDRGKIPSAAPEDERSQSSRAQGLNEQGSLYRIGMGLCPAGELFSAIVG